nr:MAG TPA: hypothetical protein [Caudoviricetes sp.]
MGRRNLRLRPRPPDRRSRRRRAQRLRQQPRRSRLGRPGHHERPAPP